MSAARPAAPSRTAAGSCYAISMIRGLHGLLYSSDAAATRTFLRDVLRLPFNDVGDGWLIFDVPEADLGVHPTDENGGPTANTHDISFYCDDIHGTVADLRARGVELRDEPQDHGYGWVTHFTMPGGIEVQLYEPRYEKAAKPAAKKPAAKPAAKKPAAKAAAKKPVKAAAKKPVKAAAKPAKKPARR